MNGTIYIKERVTTLAVICRPLTAEDRVPSDDIMCGIFGEQHSTGTGFPHTTPVHPCRYHNKNSPYSFVYHQQYTILATESIVK